jgi:hypothetical protein
MMPWRRRHRRKLVVVPFTVVVPDSEGVARVKVARISHLLATLARNVSAVLLAAGQGALTGVETLAIIGRHVARFQQDLASIDTGRAGT